MDIMETITRTVIGTQETLTIADPLYIILKDGTLHIITEDMDITIHTTTTIRTTTLHIITEGTITTTIMGIIMDGEIPTPTVPLLIMNSDIEVV